MKTVYSEGSVFLALLNSAIASSAGVVRVREITAPLWGDAEKIAGFYADADLFRDDPDWEGVDGLDIVANALGESGVSIPPRPGSLDDPLALSPDGTCYMDPAAAAAHLRALMETTENDRATLDAVQAVPAGEPAPALEKVPEGVVSVDTGVHIAGE